MSFASAQGQFDLDDWIQKWTWRYEEATWARAEIRKAWEGLLAAARERGCGMPAGRGNGVLVSRRLDAEGNDLHLPREVLDRGDGDSQMKASWRRIILLSLPLCALAIASCQGGACGGSAGSSDVCPPPTYGYAVVQGQALRSDGVPIADKQAYVSCGDAVGAYDDRTDDLGHFEVRPVYAVHDTLLYPFPPRYADGSFDVSCQASLGSLTIGSSGRIRSW